MKATILDTRIWVAREFYFNGVKYVSRLSPDSPLLGRLMSLPSEVFEEMHNQILQAEIGTTTDRDEIQVQLNRINENASHAVLELA